MENEDMHVLADREILSKLIAPQSAELLLREYKSLYNIVTGTTDWELEHLPGIGKARVKKISALRNMYNRVLMEQSESTTQINSARDVEDAFSFLKDRKQEEVWILLLDTKNNIVDRKRISIGTVRACSAGTREIFSPAVKGMATSIIMVHNHPSGDPSPSREDMDITQNLISAGRILDIPLLDHVIIGKNGSYSFFSANGGLWDKVKMTA